MVKISYIEVTARPDYPHYGNPKLHLWQPTLQTLANQKFKDFEYIVVDIFYEERKNYFKENNYGLKIKHIPAAPGVWHNLGICEICHQFNKGIIHADGELLFFCADSNMHAPWLFEDLWKHYQEGWFISCGFGADVTFGPKEILDFARTTILPTEWYRFLGYNGHVTMDFRYNQLFEGVPWLLVDNQEQKTFVPIKPSWYYGISTASLEAMLKINGFDEAFDGDGALNDVDVGYRLQMAGYNKIAMAKRCFTIEAYAGTEWHKKMKRPEIKCNYGLVLFNQLMHRQRANRPISPSDIDYIINTICKTQCSEREKCKTLPHRGPFFNKNELTLFKHWRDKAAPLYIDLEEERELLEMEGTYVNV
jgi:hypothetical protein